jgi:hypothetical protein
LEAGGKNPDSGADERRKEAASFKLEGRIKASRRAIQMKGQLGIINLFELLISFIIFMYMLPVINPVIAQTVASANAAPTEFTPLLVMLLDLIPFAVLVMLVISGFHYAIPRIQGQQK